MLILHTYIYNVKIEPKDPMNTETRTDISVDKPSVSILVKVDTYL